MNLPDKMIPVIGLEYARRPLAVELGKQRVAGLLEYVPDCFTARGTKLGVCWYLNSIHISI